MSRYFIKLIRSFPQGLEALLYRVYRLYSTGFTVFILQFTIYSVFFTFTNAIRTGNLYNLYYAIYHYTISISICEKLKVFFNLIE